MGVGWSATHFHYGIWPWLMLGWRFKRGTRKAERGTVAGGLPPKFRGSRFPLPVPQRFPLAQRWSPPPPSQRGLGAPLPRGITPAPAPRAPTTRAPGGV